MSGLAMNHTARCAAPGRILPAPLPSHLDELDIFLERVIDECREIYAISAGQRSHEGQVHQLCIPDLRVHRWVRSSIICPFFLSIAEPS